MEVCECRDAFALRVGEGTISEFFIREGRGLDRVTLGDIPIAVVETEGRLKQLVLRRW